MYGLLEVLNDRWISDVEIVEAPDSLSFGQIVPLLLLLLPILAIVEVYEGMYITLLGRSRF